MKKAVSNNIEKESSKTSKVYQILNEIFNSVTHGFATIFAIIGMVFLIRRVLLEGGSTLKLASFTIYSIMLILLFLFSTLAHSLYFTRAQKVFQVFDHSGIYLLIAGTYTPYCLVSLGNWLGWIILAIIWISAIIGIVVSAIYLPKRNQVPRISTILYVVMGWMIAIALVPLYSLLTPVGFWLLVSGGIVYTVGALIYRFKFPFAHVLWHIFVFFGALLMWLSIYGFVR